MTFLISTDDNNIAMIVFWVRSVVVVSIVVGLANKSSWTLNPWVFIVIGLGWLNSMYRLKYVDERTWRDIVCRAVVLPELFYGFWQMTAMMWSYILSYGRIKQSW